MGKICLETVLMAPTGGAPRAVLRGSQGGEDNEVREAKKWLNELERVDALQVAAKRWRAIKLRRDGREMRMQDWRGFRGQYVLQRRNFEDWNEGDAQSWLLNRLPDA